MDNKRFLIWGCGSGKTKASLEEAFATNPKRIIVYAPPVLVKTKHWQKEATKWGLDGSIIEAYGYYELQKIGKKKATSRLEDQGEGICIICDEFHKLKNSQSAQGLGIFKLVMDNPKAKYWFLSGTPAPNGYEDMCNYAKITGLVKNKTAFYDNFVIQVRYRGFPETKGYRNTDVLDKWWTSISDTKPPEAFCEENDIWVELPAVKNEQQARKTRIGVIDDEKYILETPSALAHFCRMCAGHTTVREDWLANLFDSTDENIVVFTGYKISMRRIKNIAIKSKKKFYRVDGEEKTLPDDKDIDNLKNAVIAVNYQSGGAGLNLQYANNVVFYSPTYSYSDYVQARGRVSRRGQNNKCNFYHLIAEKSIEEDIYKCLKKKEVFSDRLWGNEFYAEKNVNIINKL